VNLGFNKSERLCKHYLRQVLFAGKHTFFCYPFKVVYLSFVAEPGNPNLLEPQPAVHQQAMPPAKPVVKTQTFPAFPAKCLVSVSSRRFKRATDRNRIKRLIRESYRKNKTGFYSFLNQQEQFCLVAFIYSANEILPFSDLESKMAVSLQRLMQRIDKEKQ
jgi:ribonuclease P protein component